MQALQIIDTQSTDGETPFLMHAHTQDLISRRIVHSQRKVGLLQALPGVMPAPLNPPEERVAAGAVFYVSINGHFDKEA